MNRPPIVPELRQVGRGPNARALAERVRAGVLERRPEAIRQALAEGASPTTQVVFTKSRLTTMVDWLTWAIHEETHSPGGRERSDNVPSSGIVEALIQGGVHSWTALATFPSRSWSSHPAFRALEEDALDRLVALHGNHPLMRDARAGLASHDVVPRWKHARHDQDRPTWLVRAAHHDRLDVVERWVKHGAPVTQDGPCCQSAWWTAWYRRFQDGTMGLLRPDTRVASLLEERLLVTASDAQWRAEVLGLLGLMNESQTTGFMDHAPTREALTLTVERAVQRRPIDLVLHDDEAALLRDPQGVRALIADQENRLLKRTFAAPSTSAGPTTGRLRSRL